MSLARVRFLLFGNDALASEGREVTTNTETQSVFWREWGEKSFAASRQERKPVLLTLTATWCHWCHVMDQTSYSDPRVIALINSGFIPVRVDVDQRPDISRRYNQGGFPSVAILDSEGELLSGRVYTPPDEMLELLSGVVASYQEPGQIAPPGRAAEAPTGHSQRTPLEAGEPPDSRVLLRLEEIYDTDFGGFGLEPKQPPWEGLRFLLALYSRTGGESYLKMAVDSLDGMIAGLYDRKDQGFFRYSVSRDWKVPHYEKMAVSNANLAVLCLEVYQITRGSAYKEVAIGTLEYLSGTLYDPSSGLFCSSQDAWEEFYRLPWKDRDTAEKPPVDCTPYLGWNALAASAFIKAYAVLGETTYLRIAAHNLEVLWTLSWDPENGFRHAVGASGEQPRMLEDHVLFLRASLDLHQATGDQIHFQRAVDVALTIQKLFRADDGGYYDIAESGVTSPGVPLAKEKPVLENSLLAEALIVMACLTCNEEYRTWASQALETFEAVVPASSFRGPRPSRRVEEDEERLFLPAGSAWARARQLLAVGPVHLVILGGAAHPTTAKLLGAALNTYSPHQVVQALDPQRDAERISSLGFPVGEEPVLYACMNYMCLAPIRSVQEVGPLLAARPWAQAVNSSIGNST